MAENVRIVLNGVLYYPLTARLQFYNISCWRLLKLVCQMQLAI